MTGDPDTDFCVGSLKSKIYLILVRYSLEIFLFRVTCKTDVELRLAVEGEIVEAVPAEYLPPHPPTWETEAIVLYGDVHSCYYASTP